MVAGVDYAIVAIYLIGTAAVGVYFSKKNAGIEGYFFGSKSVPGWAIGLSILSTAVSSITFLAFPATSYILDYRLYPKDFAFPLVSLLAIYVIAPKFYRITNCASAFEVLEISFDNQTCHRVILA